ncbi:spermine/spermidine synthase domain-containing protein [Gilliamella intestini]|uniref:Spermidine synthase n=1 Tax=Gilliamella intestini TaxID=1798183 RepID=A0A1C4C5P8_9GAMM|nr:spermidine synthase [Gilliamella intestini]SCC14439.1 Spermidine synthase [Gilliamella intestini]
MKYFAWCISLLVGLMSLGQEMLWFRIVSFMLGGAPYAFALVLFFFLLGIAFGANRGKTICTRYSNLLLAGGMVLIFAGFIDILIPFIIQSLNQPNSLFECVCTCCILIFVVAALKAILFPIVHHLGTNIANGKVGASVSKVYFFNIIGSTLGSLLIGGVLLDYISISSMFILIGIVCILLGGLMIIKKSAISVSAFAILGISCFYFVDKHSDYIFRDRFGQDISINSYIENRYGVIHIANDNKDGRKNIVLGNRMYDGILNIDPDNDINDLNRLYLLAAIHPNPKKVLVIGVSGGAWTRALSSFPTLETIDAIEINKGYLDIIKQYPVVSPILDDHRINIYIDDGRRWLKRNSDKKYDLIVMNTTYHWRSGITNLLSQEMMNILHNSLNPNGILAFNSTRSLDTLKTAQSVFKYAYWGTMGFIYASDSEINIDDNVAKNRLDKLVLDGKPLFNEASKQVKNGAYQKTLATKLLSLDEVEKLYNLGRDTEIITDSNMITEYKYGFGANN